MDRKIIFSGVGGALIGAATSGAIVYFLMNKKVKATIEYYDNMVKKLELTTSFIDGVEEGLNDETVTKNPEINIMDNLIEQSAYNTGVFDPETPLVRSDEIEIIDYSSYGGEFEDYRGELKQYDILGWTYYSDGVLINENDELVDIMSTLGTYIFTRYKNEYFHDGQILPDTLYIRHHTLEADIEIAPDMLSYKDDILPNLPKQVKVEVPDDDKLPNEDFGAIWEG